MSPAESKERLFLVGIAPEIRSALAEMASVHEISDLTTVDPSFAFERALSARPHAILMGAEELARGALKFVELVKGDRRTRVIPTVLLFDRAPPRAPSYCLNLGFDDFLILDRDREALVGRVRSHIAYKRRYDEFAEGFEREFEGVLGSFGIALVSMELDGTIRFATQELARLLETPVDRIEGRKLSQLAAEEHVQRADELVAELVETGVSARAARVKLRTRTGEPVYLGLRGMRMAAEPRVVLSLAPVEREVESTLRARESQSLLRRIMRSASDGVLLLRRGRIRYSNEALRTMFGYDREEMQDASLDAFLAPESLPAVERALSQAADGGSPPRRLDLKARRKDGSEILIDLGVSSLKHQGETVVMGIVRDVTGSRRITAELQSFKDGLDEAADVVVRVTADGAVAYANRAVESYGLSPAAMVGRPFRDYIRDPLVADRLSAALAEGRNDVFEATMSAGDGRRMEARIAATPILGARGESPGAIWMIHDVTAFKANQAELIATNRELMRLHAELADSNRRLDLLSRTDELTGIANRRCFEDRLHDELARAQRTTQPFSLLLMDLDHFKKLNDTQGHQRGDEALSAIAQLFRKHMRETDLIARAGGDEFVVLLPSTGSAGAAIVADKLRQDLVGANAALGLGDIGVSISVGVATFTPPTTLGGRDLFNLADAAMYKAKARGGNCVEIANPPGPGPVNIRFS